MTVECGELAQRYERAQSDYDRRWRHIDTSLRNLVGDATWDSPEGVHTKVVFIDAVYSTRLARYLGREGIDRCAELLHANRRSILPPLEELVAAGDALTPSTATAAVALHKALLEILPRGQRKKKDGTFVETRPRSFASKFLHFHAPVVPIFDSEAVNSREGFRQLAADICTGEHLTKALAEVTPKSPQESDPWYCTHVAHVLLLWQHLERQELQRKLSVKGIDHMLLRGWRR